MSLYLGIDFGTSTNYITRWNQEKQKAEAVSNMDSLQYGMSKDSFPNVIYYQRTGAPVIGAQAYERLRIDPDNCVYAVKRHIGEDRWTQKIPNIEKSLSAEDITCDIFRAIKDKIYKNYAVDYIDGVAISVPYSYLNKERTIIKRAAESAGLKVIGLIEEPVAAALSYGLLKNNLNGKSKEKILIFDLGGGTFDVTIFEFSKESDDFKIEVLNTAGNRYLGGNDIDELLKNYFVEDVLQIPIEDRQPKYNNNILKIAKEHKENLSSYDDDDVFEAEAYGQMDLECDLSKEKIEDILINSGFIAKVLDALDEAIYEAELEPEDIDKIILVGGSSNIPLIQEKLREYFGKDPIKTENPELMVGEGAGIFCGMKANKGIKLQVIPKISSAIGVKVGTSMKAILPKNSKYKEYSGTEYLNIQNSDKDEFEIEIYQGNSKNIQKCCLIGTIGINKQDFPDMKVGIKLGTSENGDVLYQLVDINGKVIEQNIL